MEAFFTKGRSISSHLVSSAPLYFAGKYLHSDIETAGLNVRIMNSGDVSPRCWNSAVPRRNITGLHSDCKKKEFRTQHMKSCPCVTTLCALIQINQQEATVSKVFYLTFMCGSTCFGRLCAHHQERTTALEASGFTVWKVAVGALLVVV
jgi:hypothetical protein